MSKKCFSSIYQLASLCDIIVIGVWATDVFTWRVLVTTGFHYFLDLSLKLLDSCDTYREDPQFAVTKYHNHVKSI